MHELRSFWLILVQKGRFRTHFCVPPVNVCKSLPTPPVFGNFGHFGVAPGLFSVIYFNKDLKTGKYYITNTDGNGAETGKYHKLVNDLLDSYSEKLNKLSKKEN
jgi:hypothetical protein